MTVGITELPPEGMQLGGVALAGDADRGTKTTEGLSLLFTTAGITVQGPQPQIERLLVWSGLDTATCREKISLNDGRSAAVMELTSGGQSIRFLLPTETVTPGQAAYLDQALPAWLARYKGAPGSVTPAGSPSQPATTGSTVAPAAAAGAVAGAGVAAATNGTGNAPGGGTPETYATAPPPPPAAARATAPATAGAENAGPASAGAAGAGAAPYAVTPSGSEPSPAVSSPASAPPPPPPPPPTAGPPGPAVAAAAATGAAGGWEGLTNPAPPVAPGGTWQDPPLGQVPAGDVLPPPKKTRSWRKGRQDAETTPLAPGSYGQPLPPTGPPPNPVVISPGVLPPPPTEYGSPAGSQDPTVWRPPVDPVTGEAVWDTTNQSPEFIAPAEAAPKRSRWRRGAKAGAAAGAAGVAAGTVGASALDSGQGVVPPAGAPGLQETQGAWSTAPGDPYGTVVPPPAPGDGSVPPTADGHTARSDKSNRNNRTTVILLVALLALVVAGGAYYFVHKNNNASTTTPTVAPVLPSGQAAAYTLAQSINLRLTDLPAGWTRATTPAATAPRPPAAPATAVATATQALATCLTQPVSVVSGAFGATAAGQLALAASPIFVSGSDPGIVMHSVTRTMATDAQAQALAAPFGAANFAACYGQYQTSLASAAVPGSTAQLQEVTLTAPAGVRSFGYVTTFTLPGQGTEVVGQAFIFGGRTVTVLEPSTNGPAIPSSDFNPPYNAIVGRVAQAAAR